MGNFHFVCNLLRAARLRVLQDSGQPVFQCHLLPRRGSDLCRSDQLVGSVGTGIGQAKSSAFRQSRLRNRTRLRRRRGAVFGDVRRTGFSVRIETQGAGFAAGHRRGLWPQSFAHLRAVFRHRLSPRLVSANSYLCGTDLDGGVGMFLFCLVGVRLGESKS